ncbi:39S ribosomal protein L44, mitochondrial-like [Varroa jacobsoni]|uniref:39S ribosomal protein L44, mitochondrial-like n=1 Tax=Varroa jacobsoni TaxID=62625 RepID=UPI000BF99B3D|nr:39S ribosomal protein L44, mitochondrial-like [Varroa jacobsoni]
MYSLYKTQTMLRHANFDLARCLGVRGYRKSLIPTLHVMKKRQELAGERISPQRNALLEWDFGREINCLCRRLGIEPTEKIKDSFVTEAYAEQEVQRTKELGLGYKPVRSNIAMAQEGHEKLREILSVQLRESYPFLPSQALNSLLEYLTSGETLVDVATQMGLAPFVFRTGHGEEVEPELLYSSILALFSAVREKDEFCRRYILTRLCGKDVFDLWNPKDVSFLLNTILQTQKHAAYVPRIIGEAGRNTLESLYYVGVYSDRKLLGKGAGTTQAQAVDVAVRDALRRIFKVTRAVRSPFEKMAMKSLAAKIAHGAMGTSLTETCPTS